VDSFAGRGGVYFYPPLGEVARSAGGGLSFVLSTQHIPNKSPHGI